MTNVFREETVNRLGLVKDFLRGRDRPCSFFSFLSSNFQNKAKFFLSKVSKPTNRDVSLPDDPLHIRFKHKILE